MAKTNMDIHTAKTCICERDIGWLIGFLEGEGSICLGVSRRKNPTQTLRVTPKVIWTNCDHAMIEKCIDILERMGVGRSKVTKNARNNPNGLVKNGSKTIYYVSVCGFSRVARLLSFIRGDIHGENQNELTF
jgi:hypothetical protein